MRQYRCPAPGNSDFAGLSLARAPAFSESSTVDSNVQLRFESLSLDPTSLPAPPP